MSKCLPARLQKLRTQFTSPQETLRQVLNPPQTNITTTAYTIGGVDQAHPSMGVVTTSQVTSGRFLGPRGGMEALVSTTYAAKQKLKVGSTLDLNGRKFRVVGLVNPPLGGQSADVYLPLAQLQKLAAQAGLLVLDDVTLAVLFSLVATLLDAPDPVAVLEGLLTDVGDHPGTVVPGCALPAEGVSTAC